MGFFEDNVAAKIERENTLKENHSLWVEKYRPLSLDDFIGNELLKKKSAEYIKNNDLPHLLFFGKAGGGKTTLAKLLTLNMNCDKLYVNASDENSVDDVRTKIKGFAGTVGFSDLKVAILDECDFLSMNAQAALRNLMETYSKTTRFILTCNYVERVASPIVSRCQVFELIPPSKKDVAKRLITILSKEGIKYNAEDVVFIVNSYYPDIRKMINTMQMQVGDGELKIDKKSITDYDHKLKIINLLEDKNKTKKDTYKEIRQILADNAMSDFTDMYHLLYNNIDDFAPGNTAPVILIISDMAYKSAFSVDKEINFISTIIQILDKIK